MIRISDGRRWNDVSSGRANLANRRYTHLLIGNPRITRPQVGRRQLLHGSLRGAIHGNTLGLSVGADNHASAGDDILWLVSASPNDKGIIGKGLFHFINHIPSPTENPEGKPMVNLQ
jgi:hypothetical protein